jgi:4-hydroxybenzoate polyprenyltransferase
MIKFSHSLFALPFALIAMLVAAGGLPSLRTLLLILACMVTARTAAMTWNRIADVRFDAANPRTKDRALPAGRVSLAGAWILLLASCALFVLASAGLNRMTLLFSPLALAIVLGYSLAKRVTAVTHWLLGLALAAAPVGAWIAVRGRLDPPVLLLALAVLLWTAGFDVLYACQDADFDRGAGLHSVPARVGIPDALRIALGSHVAAVAAFLAFGIATTLGWPWFAATGVASLLLLWSHRLVRPDDLSRVQVAFFHVNVAVGAVMLAGAVGGLAAAA